MGKTASKKKNGQSLHSRAAKRASSPSIDIDKSLKAIKPPVEANYHPLGIHAGAGVTKKNKPGRKSVLSSKAKRRQEKSLDRAEVALDKLQHKIEKSKGKAGNVEQRRKGWEEQNRLIMQKSMVSLLPVEYSHEAADDGNLPKTAGEVVEVEMNQDLSAHVNLAATPVIQLQEAEKVEIAEDEIL